ncbi:hypothetical protein F4802DRAFT_573933 [Xylaria palmicola]|nr:hypothetical protein F4802DRAFT_573933 [Xylaria palmicola]
MRVGGDSRQKKKRDIYVIPPVFVFLLLPSGFGKPFEPPNLVVRRTRKAMMMTYSRLALCHGMSRAKFSDGLVATLC